MEIRIKIVGSILSYPATIGSARTFLTSASPLMKRYVRSLSPKDSFAGIPEPKRGLGYRGRDKL